VREVLKTNDPVELSFAEAVLADAGIGSVVFDGHMSVTDGSMVILPRRLMVAQADGPRAEAILREALSAKPEWA
jgi:Putative prokaryotic signal transducing protein